MRAEAHAAIALGVGVLMGGGLYALDHELHEPAFKDPKRVEACAVQGLGSQATKAVTSLSPACAPFESAFPSRQTTVTEYKPYSRAKEIETAAHAATGETTIATRTTYTSVTTSAFHATVKAQAKRWNKEHSFTGGDYGTIVLVLGAASLFMTNLLSTMSRQRPNASTTRAKPTRSEPSRGGPYDGAPL